MSSLKGGVLTLSLKACLEEIACLGPGYVVNECGYEWEARELLAWLQTTFPHELELQVYFLHPNPHGDGAIYQESSREELTYAVSLYRVERQRVASGNLVLPEAEYSALRA